MSKMLSTWAMTLSSNRYSLHLAHCRTGTPLMMMIVRSHLERQRGHDRFHLCSTDVTHRITAASSFSDRLPMPQDLAVRGDDTCLLRGYVHRE